MAALNTHLLSYSLVTPRWYQKEAVDAMLTCVANKINGVVVLPTGSGKTLVIRNFLEYYCKVLGNQVLLLSHVKEILEQNFECVAPLGATGIYSAGMDLRIIDQITVAGIQSVYKKPELFKGIDLVIIDECHLVSDEGMYRELLDLLDVPYLGLTATPFRLKQGYIYKSGIFDSLIYEAPIERLQDEGYLTHIDMVGSVDEMDVTGLRTTGGDFNLRDASLRFDRTGMTDKIIAGLEKYKYKYMHWLVFCIDIDHAEHVSKALHGIGVTCAAVHSKSPRDVAISEFRHGLVQAITHVNILGVGFDYPAIDLIVLLRPTKSPIIHVQGIGRGLRVAPGKTHCLVKDFAGNTSRLGFIHDLAPIKAKGKGKGGINPFCKTCPECEKISAPQIKTCECGYEFKFEHHLTSESYAAPEWYKVEDIYYSIFTKVGKPNSLKIVYRCGLKRFNQWIHLDHPGYAGYKAKYWVARRWKGNQHAIPRTIDALFAGRSDLSQPVEIMVDANKQYPKIVNAKF